MPRGYSSTSNANPVSAEDQGCGESIEKNTIDTTITYRWGSIAWVSIIVFATGVPLLLLLLLHEENRHEFILPNVKYTTPVTFQPNYLYWNVSSAESARAWELVNRHGEIFLPESEKYNLPLGIERAHGYQSYPLSAFHQLHCLKTIRKHYAALFNKLTLDDPVDNHIEHCFDYLRQSIMCAADMTIEKARVDPDGHRRAVDGWKTTHQCRNWEKVQEVVKTFGCSNCKQ